MRSVGSGSYRVVSNMAWEIFLLDLNPLLAIPYEATSVMLQYWLMKNMPAGLVAFESQKILAESKKHIF